MEVIGQHHAPYASLPVSHWIGDSLGPRISLENVEESEISGNYWKTKSRPLYLQPVD